MDFPGWVDEAGVKALNAKADILVLPSHAEGLAMAVLEGLSYGLVVVTTPVGAHTEVIEPDVSGILVPPGDVAALADALARVIDDGAPASGSAVGARHRFLEKFDVRGYSDRLSQLHIELLSHSASSNAANRERGDIVMGWSDPNQDGEPMGTAGSVPRVNILGVGVTGVNLPEAIATLEKWREERRRDYVCCVTVHGLVMAQRNPVIRSALNRAGLATMDGMPLVWLCRRAGFAQASRVCGPDLLEAMCARGAPAGPPPFLLRQQPTRRRAAGITS